MIESSINTLNDLSLYFKKNYYNSIYTEDNNKVSYYFYNDIFLEFFTENNISTLTITKGGLVINLTDESISDLIVGKGLIIVRLGNTSDINIPILTLEDRNR